jgi:predicted nucleic acid-binding protein
MAMMAGNILFLDTNVLLTATDESRPQHREATRLLAESTRRGLRLAGSGQILREYMVVASRPIRANGFGLNVRDVVGNVDELRRHLQLFDETQDVAGKLRQLALKYDLQGKGLHDANIVATMATHGIRTLVTQNHDDFARFDEIDTVSLIDLVRA